MKTIVLFGDSLINHPFNDFDLAGYLHRDLKQILKGENNQIAFNIVNQGYDGNKVSELKEDVKIRRVLDSNPDIVIIFFDSDISDTEIEVLETSEYQSQYRKDLQYVIDQLKPTVQYIAIASPGLLGQGSLFRRNKYKGKDRFLDLCSEINRQVVESNRSSNCVFIDMRRAWKRAVPFYNPLSTCFFQDTKLSNCCWLCLGICMWGPTVDGEHPNLYGTRIESRQFALAIDKLLSNSTH